MDRYRLRWNDVTYEPGEIVAVAYDAKGNETGRDTVRTAGEPANLSILADKDTILANGDDMAFVTIELTDSRGTTVPTATNSVTINVDGAATFQAACNGDATSLTPFVSNKMELFGGKLVAIVRSSRKAGDVTVRATVDGTNISKEIKLKSVR